MHARSLPRRDFLAYGSAAVASLTALGSSLARAFPAQPGEEVIPWINQPPEPRKVKDLNSWLTPNCRFFSISH